MLTAAQVGSMLGLSLSKVYDLARSGDLRCYRFGGAVRFEPADVEAYKAACKVVVLDPSRSLTNTRNYSVSLVPAGVTDLDRAFAEAGVKPRKNRPTKAAPYSRKR